MTARALIAAALTSFLAAAPVAAQDLDSGAKLYKKECRGCHGRTGKGLSSYPKLAGKPQDYLAERLEQYRAGKKLGPNTPLMAPRAKKLSDADIANLSNYIATSFR
ncbi:MAG: c-type cytochrome [Pseudomonadota bacterium]